LRALVAIFALFVVVAPRPAAAAEKSVGLLVHGDVLKAPTQEQAQKWLRGHGHKVVTNALPKEAVKTLLDCFVVDDPKCARSVIDARATTDSLVAIRLDVVSKKDKDVRLTMDWFVKGRNPVSSRRTCEDCSESALRSTIDSMLLDLAKQNPGLMGRIKLISEPPGITVLLDNETIGVTPVERDVAAGEHTVRLVRDGHMGTERSVNVEAGALAEIKLETPAETAIVDDRRDSRAQRSRTLPLSMLVMGAAAVATGAVLTFYVHDDPTIDTYEYQDYKTPGYITMGVGGLVAIVGGVLLLTSSGDSGPAVGATSSGDATIGWSGRF
jgi:hypothetical protein